MDKSKYLFHFVVSGKINALIINLKEKLVIKKNCDLFDYILEIIAKNIHNLKGIIGDHRSEYDFIDIEDPVRIDKYVRLNEEKYKMLKKWHNKYNEYGMSVILRDIIKFFYNGIIKYGMDEFLNMIGKKLDLKKIKSDIKGLLTQMMRTSIKKILLFSHIIENLPLYSQKPS
ncbi:MAG: hypothetical protein KA885_10605 [Spirochaetes bacterium]|nr:hypothetical protein [Spirochaetota bacterium]